MNLCFHVCSCALRILSVLFFKAVPWGRFHIWGHMHLLSVNYKPFSFFLVTTSFCFSCMHTFKPSFSAWCFPQAVKVVLIGCFQLNQCFSQLHLKILIFSWQSLFKTCLCVLLFSLPVISRLYSSLSSTFVLTRKRVE